ncbi:unnamed protein product [Zymoseptoria tritici ST99CH_3D1]|nr:unnamed protein product [Zymoseptoria tritici ST99CH_3D1]
MDAPDELPPPPPPAFDFTAGGIPPRPAILAHAPTIMPNPFAAVPVPVPQTSFSQQTESSQDPEPDSEDNSNSEHDESEDEEPRPSRWTPIIEDKSEPCADELAYIASREEHSAMDHAYWEKETFFELNDPDLVPLESGRIDWLVQGVNGTKENPNNEVCMRSPIVRIAGLDWQIKFYPKGNQSEYLSVYLECVSMLSPDYAETEDFLDPPFPFLKGTEQTKKRRSVAAQISVVMYNPAEPRVYEVQTEAHQFHKKQADYGWLYFTRYPRYDFHVRQHTQRQAILRDDKLAFKAYIRVIQDPTGSMWEHSGRLPDQITSVTGLRPFTKSLQYIASAVPLLHFSPFRKFVQDLEPNTRVAQWLQPLLLKMYTRKRSASYGSPGTVFEGDVMEMLWKISIAFHESYDGEKQAMWHALVGRFHAEGGSACGTNRLNTKDYPSIQAAVNAHPKIIECPQLLTLELQRHEHDKKARKWQKLTNKVQVDDHIEVNGVRYTLFAFITHCGHITSSRYNTYVRPRGIGKGWYGYQDALVTRLTEKQARDRHSGSSANDGLPKTPDEKIENGYDSPFSEFHEPRSEVTCAVMYVRDNIADDTFNAPSVEMWVPPCLIKPEQLTLALAPDQLPKTAIHEEFPDLPAAMSDRTEVDTPEPESQADDLAASISRAAGADTPEPVLMDGEDTIMRDADDSSIYSIETLDAIPATSDTDLEKGTVAWLGRAYYEGHWRDRLYHGGGHLIATNGDEYLGRFHNGLQHGYGKMIYAGTGDIYEGEWAEGRHHGKGKLTEDATKNVFEGSWKEGRKHGEFVLKGNVTEEDKSQCTICYDREITTAFYDCGHVVACRECASVIENCPVCRRRVVARLQLYGVKLLAG